MTRKGHI